ncbi:conserved hypothetical protein [Vibrio nigripulchritudo SFn27]|uniref:Uncharacterized protein n=1 Tax=Vibrio nigripulchritudo TaxID=28173 RepID=U4KEH7_9VIBR|nr:hypothetical protein [Vibrio nigripulchritudo]CCN81374.1 conserved hypothetical protein [Vibrio nigripulchritudo BLFn1]CCN91229.1 conserved hypothetical protein [Vibrio nigripulchritudo SFn27]CCN96328.1 conserved hypothetical protein [Vibrio nigripulchritudo ENn2]CCO38544.1 conserved hypothetical protein [Vibrio nigripulchritudo SFn135]CCO50427.1 conserved hypothetical protein [Vibrio nigripulchritudo Wn13]
MFNKYYVFVPSELENEQDNKDSSSCEKEAQRQALVKQAQEEAL